jgi:phosphoribosylamine--glycine ligase
MTVEWAPKACVTVVMASGGYPGDYQKGLPIDGLQNTSPDTITFHAGTGIDKEGRLVTTGGRVLSVTGCGQDLEDARGKVYDNLGKISFEGAHYRRDIAAFDAV